jgi:hypothetical protein
MATSFDAENYRKEALAAGISESIVNKTIADYGQSDVARKPTQADVQIGSGYEWLEPALYTLAVAETARQAPKIYKSIKDRFFSPTQALAPIEPQMDVSQRPLGRQEPRMVGDLFPADVSTKPIGPTPENPTVDLNTEIGKEPKGSEIVKKAAENPEKNAVLKGRQEASNATVKSFERDAKGNIKYPEGMTPAAKAGAEAFAAQYPDQAKAFASKGQFGILGAGSSMNSLYNTWGENVAKQLRNELVSGNLLGGAQEYPGMLSKIAAIPPESATGKQLADIREKNPKGGTHGVLGKSVTMQEGKLIEGKNKVPGIVAKGIGPAVLLMSIADAAKAKSAREGAGVLAEGAFNALAPMGIAPSELAPSTLTEKQLNAYKEAQKLGSPYRSVPPPR